MKKNATAHENLMRQMVEMSHADGPYDSWAVTTPHARRASSLKAAFESLEALPTVSTKLVGQMRRNDIEGVNETIESLMHALIRARHHLNGTR